MYTTSRSFFEASHSLFLSSSVQLLFFVFLVLWGSCLLVCFRCTCILLEGRGLWVVFSLLRFQFRFAGVCASFFVSLRLFSITGLRCSVGASHSLFMRSHGLIFFWLFLLFLTRPSPVRGELKNQLERPNWKRV